MAESSPYETHAFRPAHVNGSVWAAVLLRSNRNDSKREVLQPSARVEEAGSVYSFQLTNERLFSTVLDELSRAVAALQLATPGLSPDTAREMNSVQRALSSVQSYRSKAASTVIPECRLTETKSLASTVPAATNDMAITPAQLAFNVEANVLELLQDVLGNQEVFPAATVCRCMHVLGALAGTPAENLTNKGVGAPWMPSATLSLLETTLSHPKVRGSPKLSEALQQCRRLQVTATALLSVDEKPAKASKALCAFSAAVSVAAVDIAHHCLMHAVGIAEGVGAVLAAHVPKRKPMPAADEMGHPLLEFEQASASFFKLVQSDMDAAASLARDTVVPLALKFQEVVVEASHEDAEGDQHARRIATAVSAVRDAVDSHAGGGHAPAKDGVVQAVAALVEFCHHTADVMSLDGDAGHVHDPFETW